MTDRIEVRYIVFEGDEPTEAFNAEVRSEAEAVADLEGILDDSVANVTRIDVYLSNDDFEMVQFLDSISR